MSSLAAVGFVLLLLLAVNWISGKVGPFLSEARKALKLKREFDDLEPDAVRDWASLRKAKQLADMPLDEVRRRFPRLSAESARLADQLGSMNDEQRVAFFDSIERSTNAQADEFIRRTERRA